MYFKQYYINFVDWGVICGDGWSILEAMVVCHSLGLNYASYAAQTNFFGGNSSAIILNGIHCHGNESNLGLCTIDFPYSKKCPGRQDQIAGVICISSLVSHYTRSVPKVSDLPRFFSA